MKTSLFPLQSSFSCKSIKVILLAVCALPGFAFAGASIQDDFKVTEQRPAGTKLDGAVLASGGALWAASPNLQVGAAGASVANASSFVAAIPVPTEGDVISAKATLKVLRVESGSQGWVGIGLGSPNVKEGEILWKNGILLMLDGDGKYQSFIEFGKNKLYVASKKIENFDFAKLHALRIDYNRVTKILDFWVDDQHIVQSFDLAARGRTPDVSFAGFSGTKSTPNVPTVGEFSLTVGAATAAAK